MTCIFRHVMRFACVYIWFRRVSPWQFLENLILGQSAYLIELSVLSKSTWKVKILSKPLTLFNQLLILLQFAHLIEFSTLDVHSLDSEDFHFTIDCFLPSIWLFAKVLKSLSSAFGWNPQVTTNGLWKLLMLFGQKHEIGEISHLDQFKQFTQSTFGSKDCLTTNGVFLSIIWQSGKVRIWMSKALWVNLLTFQRWPECQ